MHGGERLGSALTANVASLPTHQPSAEVGRTRPPVAHVLSYAQDRLARTPLAGSLRSPGG
jgi:hypothetical protein